MALALVLLSQLSQLQSTSFLSTLSTQFWVEALALVSVPASLASTPLQALFSWQVLPMALFKASLVQVWARALAWACLA